MVMLEPGIEFPTSESRTYLNAYDLGAVYAATDGNWWYIRSTRDIERSFLALRSEVPDAVICCAWWCDTISHARLVAKKARDLMEGQLSAAPGAAVALSAEQQAIRLRDHDATLGRVAEAIERFNERYQAAHNAGALKFFNSEFKQRRLAFVPKDGTRFPTYAEASAKLRRFLLISHARTDRITFCKTTLLRYVFGNE